MVMTETAQDEVHNTINTFNEQWVRQPKRTAFVAGLGLQMFYREHGEIAKKTLLGGNYTL